MKTFIKAATVIMIILAYTACGTSKLSSRQKRIVTLRQQTSTHTKEQQEIALARTTVLKDSSGHDYQLTIFPTDTVEFSLQNGFKGIAFKIELQGTTRAVLHTDDSTLLTGSVSRNMGTGARTELDIKQLEHSKSVERKGFKLSWLVFAALAGFGIWGYSQFRGNDRA